MILSLLPVILSEAKDLSIVGLEILHFVQDDEGRFQDVYRVVTG
jgi:hypothetical protein